MRISVGTFVLFLPGRAPAGALDPYIRLALDRALPLR